MTEDELKRTRWWWRRLVFAQFVEPDGGPFRTRKAYQTVPLPAGIPPEWDAALKRGEISVAVFLDALKTRGSLRAHFSIWKRNDELAAWRHELVRRCLHREDVPAWIDLKVHQQAWIDGALMERTRVSVRSMASPPHDLSRWSDPIQPWQWDLTADDEALARVFLRWIDEQRQSRGLPTSRSPRKSQTGIRRSANRQNRNRGISWYGIELLDLATIRSLNENERKVVEKARRTARSWAPAWEAALANIVNYQPQDGPGLEDNFCRRFLRENWARLVAANRPELSDLI